jgi:hypothetical protein
LRQHGGVLRHLLAVFGQIHRAKYFAYVHAYLLTAYGMDNKTIFADRQELWKPICFCRVLPTGMAKNADGRIVLFLILRQVAKKEMPARFLLVICERQPWRRYESTSGTIEGPAPTGASRQKSPIQGRGL